MPSTKKNSRVLPDSKQDVHVHLHEEPSHSNAATLINGCGYKITSDSNDKKICGLAIPMLLYYTIYYIILYLAIIIYMTTCIP